MFAVVARDRGQRDRQRRGRRLLLDRGGHHRDRGRTPIVQMNDAILSRLIRDNRGGAAAVVDSCGGRHRRGHQVGRGEEMIVVFVTVARTVRMSADLFA